MTLNLHKLWKSNLGLINQDKFDHITQMIKLSGIILSGTHCTKKAKKNVIRITIKLVKKSWWFDSISPKNISCEQHETGWIEHSMNSSL